MSVDITVYCKNVSAALLPKFTERLNDYDMIVEVHPEFRFDEEADSGFVPFRFRFKNARLHVLKNKTLKSGFELYIDDFDLDKERENSKPKLGWLDRLRGKKIKEEPFAPPEVERLLKGCNKAVTFAYHVSDSFEGRLASLGSAILTEITGGVCYYTDSGTWYVNKDIVDKTFREIVEEENSLAEDEINFHEFDEW